MVPALVAMHLETMEAVSREAKRLPPIQKPKIHSPSLLPGEELVCPGLRVYLTSDGRDEYCGGVGGGKVLLPAEGAIFLTNCRVVFKGSPLDPFSSEHSVTRAFPITSLTKEKLFSMNEYISEIDQVLKNGIQLRSSTFQLIRAAFDDEVTAEEIANFRSLIHHTQYPQVSCVHPLSSHNDFPFRPCGITLPSAAT
jgi:myotubularin-related protein 5/13